MPLFEGKRTIGRLALVGILIGAELYLAGSLTSKAAVQGYTATNSYSIAPPRSARIREVAVDLGATVHEGDLIAQLDTTEIDNELELANADRRVAAAAMVAATARLRRESVDLERRLATTSERATADLATAEATARTAAAELVAVDAELVEQTDLVSKRLANASVLNTLQLRRAALAKQVDAADSVLHVLRGNATAAKGRAGGLDADANDQLAPLQARLQAADLKVEQLTREREQLTLRAPADGVIDALPLHIGDLAAPQTPVATVVSPDAQRVVTCIPEARARSVEPGLEAEVTSVLDRTHTTGSVESVTGTIASLPTRCQPPGSKVPMMGRIAIITLDHPIGGLPGQTQLVKFSARRRPPRTRPTPAPRSSSSNASAPTAVVVPKELETMKLEPSGLTWVPSLERFVVVSDDTGVKGGTGHPPWLYTMSATGVFDPSPLVVAGVDELNDLESIAGDDDGGVWLLASLSRSHKDRWPASRRRLAHVVFEKTGAVRIDHQIDLGALLENDPKLLAELGVTDLGALDLEAMAYHGGALYIGLKAPVDSDGHASIWRVAAPAKLLAGDLAGSGITKWATVKVTVQADHRSVAGGIADMMFWDDDTLVFSVTASGIDAKVQDGAIYVAKAAAGELVTRKIREFANGKPEGIARGPNKELVVVFDRGQAELPTWIRIAETSLRTPAP